MSLTPLAQPLSEGALLHACASKRFTCAVLERAGTIAHVEALIDAARGVWWRECTMMDWLEAFSAHPKIGDIEGLKRKHGAFADSSRGEQAAAVESGSDAVFQELADWNKKYELKFGHIFIICASGKTAGEMLTAIQSRYPNAPHTEVGIAAAEQMKITELRLRAAFAKPDAPVDAATSTSIATAERRTAAGGRSPITTHILDTALGKPAAGVNITLLRLCPGSVDHWQAVGSGITNDDGRVATLMAPGSLQAGTYCMEFQTSPYLACTGPASMEVPFYPRARVEFNIAESQLGQHFHIPLLLNPFGYSTYRGS